MWWLSPRREPESLLELVDSTLSPRDTFGTFLCTTWTSPKKQNQNEQPFVWPSALHFQLGKSTCWPGPTARGHNPGIWRPKLSESSPSDGGYQAPRMSDYGQVPRPSLACPCVRAPPGARAPFEAGLPARCTGQTSKCTGNLNPRHRDGDADQGNGQWTPWPASEHLCGTWRITHSLSHGSSLSVRTCWRGPRLSLTGRSASDSRLGRCRRDGIAG